MFPHFDKIRSLKPSHIFPTPRTTRKLKIPLQLHSRNSHNKNTRRRSFVLMATKAIWFAVWGDKEVDWQRKGDKESIKMNVCKSSFHCNCCDISPFFIHTVTTSVLNGEASSRWTRKVTWIHSKSIAACFLILLMETSWSFISIRLYFYLTAV